MLTIIHNSVDISREQSRFEFLPSEIDFDGKHLFIGYYKPINHFFLNVPDRTPDEEGEGFIDPALVVAYWNGTEYDNVKGLKDFTFGLTQQGPVTFDLDQTNNTKKVEFGKELFWYRITLNSPDIITFKGIAPLFSDDQDLIGVYPDIMQKVPAGQTSFVRFHQEAVNDIVKDLRKMGLVIDGCLMDASKRKQIDAYDLLDRDEVKEAAKYFTLSKIFSWLSDQAGDKWEQLSAKYESEAAGSLTPLITIDENNNGKKDDWENAQPQPIIIGRL
jgi:hypothetical protein